MFGGNPPRETDASSKNGCAKKKIKKNCHKLWVIGNQSLLVTCSVKSSDPRSAGALLAGGPYGDGLSGCLCWNACLATDGQGWAWAALWQGESSATLVGIDWHHLPPSEGREAHCQPCARACVRLSGCERGVWNGCVPFLNNSAPT